MQGGSSNRRGAHEPQRDSTLSRSMVALEDTNSVLLRGGSVGQPASDEVSSSVAPSMASAMCAKGRAEVLAEVRTPI